MREPSLYSNPLYVRTKGWLFEFLFRSGLVNLFRLIRHDAVLVAIYHDVLPAGFPEGNPLFGMTVSVEEFAWQIDYFKKHYGLITLQQFSDWYFRGIALPRCPVLITFDDGHANNLRFALPVLQRENVTAVCFVLTGELGSCRQTWFEDAYYRLMFSPAHSWCLRNGECWHLETAEQRAAACGRFFSLCRTLPEAEQQEELQSLQSQLPLTDPVPDNDGEFRARFEFLSEDNIRLLAENGIEIGIWLSLLTCAGRPVAMRFSPVYNSTLHLYSTCFDEAFAKSSPSMLHLETLLEYAFRSGITCVDFGLGESPQKEFAGESADQTLVALEIFQGRMGSLESRSYQAVERMRSRSRLVAQTGRLLRRVFPYDVR